MVDADALIDDYLGRLRSAAEPLAVDRRMELVDEVREHIAAAIAEAGRRDESTVRNVLDRLGQPEQIVAAEADPDALARTRADAPPSGTAQTRTWGPVELTALLFLTLGSILLPFVGPLIGLVFVWLSNQWTMRNKAIATAIVLTLLILPVVLLFPAGAGADAG
jgi:uncharacterized membrane protein